MPIETEAQKAKCDNCKFSHNPNNDPEELKNGWPKDLVDNRQCRKNSKQLSDAISCFPIVHLTEWCGEYKWNPNF